MLVCVLLLLLQSSEPIYLDPRAGEDAGVVDVSEFVGNYPKKILDEYDQALEDARDGKADQAIARLEEIVKTVPEFYAAQQNLGILYQRSMRFRDAERQFRMARTLNPRSAAPLVNLAGLFVEEAGAGSFQVQVDRALLNQALENLQEAFKLQPSSALAHYLSGVVYFQTSFYEEAEDHFNQALDGGGPRMRFVRLAIANVHIRLQEWDAVVRQLDTYLRENPFARNRDQVREVRNAAEKKLESTRE